MYIRHLAILIHHFQLYTILTSSTHLKTHTHRRNADSPPRGSNVCVA